MNEAGERQTLRENILEGRKAAFRHVIREWQETPPSKDPYIAAYALAVEESLDAKDKLHDFITELLDAQDMGSTTLATKILRATQRQILFGGWDDTEGEYPRSFHTPDQWHKAFDWVLAEEGSERDEQFFSDVWSRTLQSNVPERYMAVKAFIVLARKMGRLGTVRMLDIGTSQMAGINLMASGLAFPATNYMQGAPIADTLDLQRTATMHHIINAELGDFSAVGADKYSLKDGWEWAWACSHYPHELEDEARVERVRSLMGELYPNVRFFQANFTDLEPRRDELRQQHGTEKFTITHWSNVLEQLNQNDRDDMIAEAAPLTEEFMVVNGFLKLDPRNHRRLLPLDDWFAQNVPYPYKTFVRDMKAGDERWRPVFEWSNARMHRVTMGYGRIALLGADGRIIGNQAPRTAFNRLTKDVNTPLPG